MALTDTKVRLLKPGLRPTKVTDGDGLHLLVTPQGSKLWRLSYRFNGKQKTLAIGVYPAVGLAMAREKRSEARKLLAQGIDPSAARKAEKAARRAAGTFAVLADNWFQTKVIAEGKGERATERAKYLVKTLNADLGQRPPSEIEPPELLGVLRKVEARGRFETVARLRSTASQIFRFGIAEGSCVRDPAADLRGALASPKVRHRPAILDPAGIGALMRAIDAYTGAPVTRLGLKLLAYTFVRPGELRYATWNELDSVQSLWNIPAQRTKMRRDHLVPLSRQAVALLFELKTYAGENPLAFPSISSRGRPISENTLNIALRRMGYSAEEMVAHGFRAMASTRLREMNRWPAEVIERQLAHVETNSVRRAYNRAEHLRARIETMQAWADYLDDLRDCGRVFMIAGHTTN